MRYAHFNMTPLTIPSDYPSDISAQLDYLTSLINDVVSNTSSFGAWDNFFNTAFAWGSAIVTIFIAFQIGKRRLSRKTQHNIILDLMRHMMVNSAILENIIPVIGTSKPIEGTLSRFSTLENDMELSRFMLDARYYKELHNVSLKIRNYNSMVTMADKHIHTPGYSPDNIIKELNSINDRAVSIVLSLMELSQKMYKTNRITYDDFVEYMLKRYKQPPYKASRTHYCCPFFSKGALGSTYDHLIEMKSHMLIMY